MTTIVTFLAAFFILTIALLLTAIGWFFEGERKVLKACCGKKPEDCSKSTTPCCMEQNRDSPKEKQEEHSQEDIT